MRNSLIISFFVFFFTGCVSMEWRGGMIPHVGFSKDAPAKKNTIVNDSVSLRESTSQWNQYRGPNRDGHIPPQGVAINWKGKPKALWKVPAGAGHSSVLVAKQTVYTLEQNGDSETLFARNLSDGQEKWKFAQQTKWNDMMSGTGPRSTPTLLGGKLYTLFSNGLLCRVNAKDGKLDWKIKTVDENYEFPEWGISCSPLVWNELIILNLGGENGAVRAYSINDGKLVWTSNLSGNGFIFPRAFLICWAKTICLPLSKEKLPGSILKMVKPYGKNLGRSF